MKKIKLLAGVAGVAGLTACLTPVMTGCSCGDTGTKTKVESYKLKWDSANDRFDYQGESSIEQTLEPKSDTTYKFTIDNVTESSKKVYYFEVTSEDHYYLPFDWNINESASTETSGSTQKIRKWTLEEASGGNDIFSSSTTYDIETGSVTIAIKPKIDAPAPFYVRVQTR